MGSYISYEELKELEISLGRNKSLKKYCNLYNLTLFILYVLIVMVLINIYKLIK